MRTVIILGLVLILLALTLPALAVVEEMPNGVSVVNGTALAAEGTPKAAIAYAASITAMERLPGGNYGGSMNTCV